MSKYPQGPVVVTKFWEKLPDGRAQCNVCPHRCKLKDGQQGLCFVRAAQGGGIVLTTYGRSSGFCIDPIEKKPLHHFLPGTAILSFGTAGCNLRCSFCQNWHISRAKEADVSAEVAAPERIVAAAAAMGCRSVAFTYNDPVVFLEYAVDVAQACHEQKLRAVAVTAGYISAGAREAFFEHMDAANVDLKAFTEAFYRKQCGGDLQTVKDTLVYLKHRTKVWVELTTLLIPGENDSEDELRQLSAWVAGELGPETPLQFSAFHPAWHMTDRPPTPPATLLRAREVAQEAGLHYVFTGNVRDESNGSTYCHGCGKRLIGRDWFRLTEWNLKGGGVCKFCGAVCAGVFEDQPGTWGPRCVPVDISEL